MRTFSRYVISVVGMAAVGVILSGCGASRGEKNPLDIATLDPFMQAVVYAKSGDDANLEKCIENDPDIIVKRDAQGNTLLHYAAIASQFNTVELLLYYGADVNARDLVDGKTPLQAAEAEHANDDVLELLQKAAGM